LDDVAAELAHALDEPLDYPALSRCTTPGDRVVIAVAPGVPQSGLLVAETIRSLVAGGVQADGITVLRRAEDAAIGEGDPAEWLSGTLRDQIAMAVHDPDDRDSIAYLAANDDGEPILLNRLLTDADVVLPIGCFGDWHTAGYHGIQTAIYPTYSDRAALGRFRSLESAGSAQRATKHLAKEADHVGWLLGAMFTIQVVPGPGDRVQHVLAGETGSVRRRGWKLHEAVWHGSVPGHASLVVASIEGGPRQQTWENVARALAAAARLVEPDGAIALCCELTEEPGPAVQRLATAGDRDEALREIRDQSLPDGLVAVQLAETLARARVYLLSELDESLVEGLEMAPIARGD